MCEGKTRACRPEQETHQLERENRSAHHQRAWLLQPWNPWTLLVTHASSRHPKTLYDSASSWLRRSNGAPLGGRVTATVRCLRCCWRPSRPVPTVQCFAATESCQIWTRHSQAEITTEVSRQILYLAFEKLSFLDFRLWEFVLTSVAFRPRSRYVANTSSYRQLARLSSISVRE